MTNPAKKPALYENVGLHEELTRSLECDDAWARAFTFAVGDDSPELSAAAGPRRLAPSAGIARDLMVLFLEGYDTTETAGLHQRQDIWYHRPVRVGDTLTLKGRYVEKYERRGKGYVVFESEAVNAAGEVVVSQRCTEVMSIPPGIETATGTAHPPSRKIEGIWPDGVPTVDAPSMVTSLPAPLPLIEKELDQNAMSVFSGVASHRRNIHNNLEKAQKFGFDRCVAAGMMEACWLSEMATRYFGSDFLMRGHVSAVFLSPIFAGDVVTCRGVVTDETRTENAARIQQLEFWCENGSAQRTAVGTAACPV